MDVDSDNEIGTPRKRARMVPKPGPASSLRSSTGLGKQSRVQNSQFSETNPKIVVTPQGLLERVSLELLTKFLTISTTLLPLYSVIMERSIQTSVTFPCLLASHSSVKPQVPCSFLLQTKTGLTS